MIKKISILGSTGSIGLNVLKIIDKKRKDFNIILLSANKNYSLICYQIKKYKPKYFIINDEATYKRLKKKFSNHKTIILDNLNFHNKKLITNITVLAIPGLAGLEPTIKMISLSKKVLIANKESIICGWNLIEKAARKNKTNIIPVDSEHFSISELIKNHQIKEIKKVYLTASGGPFLNYTLKELKKVKPQEALNHPKWKMGKKITVDSATLMNKMFEVVEAQKLFNIPISKLEILIHPESLVHAIIAFNNGLIKFIYHETSMIIPIANAILERDLKIENFFKTKKRNLNIIKDLTFQKVNSNIFPVIKLKTKINELPSSPIIFNAFNEILVDRFLKKKLSFLGISKTIMSVLNTRLYKKYAIRNPKNIKEIINIDNWARESITKKLR